MDLRIGNIKLENPFILAPLAGITDAPMRRLCREMGAALAYSEMISGKGLMYKDKNTERLLTIFEDEKPVAFQIFGREPEIIELTAAWLADRENAILDINMGCPVPKIVKNGEGSALMKDPDLVYRIVAAAVSGSRRGAAAAGKSPEEAKPVTVKMRSGFEAASVNAVSVAKAAEAAGAAAVAVHGRTREQYYSGKADWKVIADVKAALKIPVIGNGDVFSGEDAIALMNETGCDFVMIARGALGNPWIFREALALYEGREMPLPPDIAEKKKIMLRHLEDVIGLKGEYAGVREMRKHAAWYMKGVPHSAAFRGAVNNITDAEELKKAIKGIGEM